MAIAARSQLASLRSIGFFSNPLLLLAIAAELLVTAVIIWVPSVQSVFDTTGVTWWQLLLVAPFPVLVWGVDELLRWRRRTRAAVSRLSQEVP
ncbi:MAG: cation-translocating P-type ATPase C-terminal domain-containing protein [Propionibacteriales bacterium]|nr:cation-translocating P-type ATPase C-terminal domain-containing protein [Propionibacteriales bacterium]